jgi:hypothetical protein
MDANESIDFVSEAQLDRELAEINSKIRARLLRDSDLRQHLHARHERVLAARRDDDPWVLAWVKLWSVSKRTRNEGKAAIAKLHDQEREDDAPKERKIASDDDDEGGDYGCASEF